jgi:hypothetical protein
MEKKSVPQTTPKTPDTPHVQQEFDFSIVKLEPDLQARAATMTPQQRRELADTFGRWRHQLLVSASVLEKHATPWKRRRLPRIDRKVLVLN